MLNWNFQRGWGVQTKKTFCGGYGYFLEQHIVNILGYTGITCPFQCKHKMSPYIQFNGIQEQDITMMAKRPASEPRHVTKCEGSINRCLMVVEIKIRNSLHTLLNFFLPTIVESKYWLLDNSKEKKFPNFDQQWINNIM